MNNVAVYCRVSSEDQAERGTIESQIEFAMKYVDLHQLNLYKIYKEDGVSGTIPLHERPVGIQLIEDAINKKFDTLLIYKLDRLGRSARVTLNSIYQLEQLGVQIKSMTEPFDTSNPSGRFMITMLAGVADLERETILERMWHGANRAAREGKWLGGIVPYGYIVDSQGYLVVNDERIGDLEMSEKEVVQLIFDLVGNKKYSTMKVADYLNSLKIPTHYQKDDRQILKGKRKANTAGVWLPNNIGRMIKNTTYKGVHYYGKRSKKQRDVIERKVPAIVSEDLWDKCQEVLKNNQILSMKNSKRNYLLRGLIRCELCNSTYHGSFSTKHEYYICTGKTKYKGPGYGRCKAKNIRSDFLNKVVWEDVVNFINNPGKVLNFLDTSNNNNNIYTLNNLESEIDIIKSRLDNIETEKESILNLFRKNIITSLDVEKQFENINKDKIQLQERLLELEKEILNVRSKNKNTDKIREFLSDMKYKLETNEVTFELKREIIETLVGTIKVNTIFDENGKAKINIKIEYNFDCTV
ncbi:site-specific DNA recombinase [Alkalithermobacter thermoalcaliphilus JW-YL-7 = DSM 7308]|uniref:Resolvase domain-containing protein n=1 Tax=Alkalithermobacter thermoalcaliphilus JW-YL-7 = DSM 7308 TaxID=1121328 RepID=A0A150FR05_CLOPD|nr:Resolvase domain-containing protein [[Clostridium] paradoxum JW-YL-7 = DSM 7308]SHL12254.1 site-specific DNA recombinase [[Clostridium] paradoxum JW-YL-7 = DSM 7308]